MEAQGIEPWSE